MQQDSKRPTGRTCQECGASIDHLKTHALYCGRRCQELKYGDRLQAPLASRSCEQCGASYQPVRRSQRACSTPCGRRLTQREKYWKQKGTPEREAARRAYLVRRRERDLVGLREGKRLREAARRARLRGNLVVPFTAEQLAARLSMWPGCWRCGQSSEQVDHVKPIAAGGPHCLANLRPICAPCNRRKWSTWEGPRALERSRSSWRVPDPRVPGARLDRALPRPRAGGRAG